MADQRSQRVKAGRLLAEGVVIVASILLAFGIDAWWDARNERIQERALLAALAGDSYATKDALRHTRRAHETVLASMERLLTYAENGAVPVSERAQVDTVLSRVFWREIFDPPVGAVETILGSGRLDVIENQELVGELTRWTAAVHDLNELERAGTDHFYRTLYPYLSANLDLQDLDKGIPWKVPWPHDPTPAADLVTDPAFKNVIYMHYVLYHNVLEVVPRLELAIERIIAITEQELR
jgi:hypothetical protein